MKIRKRAKISPIHLRPSDTITLTRKQIAVSPTGKEMGVIREDIVLSSKIGREIIVDEAVIFDVEKGDFKGAKDGIGGALLAKD